MFYSLTGKIEFCDEKIVVINCGGVGYKCYASLSTIQECSLIGSEIKLYTYLLVREDAMDLYGFATKNELEFFKLLININGVGARVAIAILSNFAPEKLAMCIASADVKSITTTPGVGPKLAQRLVLELKDKVSSNNLVNSSDILNIGNINLASNSGQAVEALVSLGYNKSEASMVVAKFESSLSVEEIIKKALQQMSSGR